MEVNDILEMDLELTVLDDIKRHFETGNYGSARTVKSKMECKLKRCIHFINRTGKLPSRKTEDAREKEYFSVITYIKKEGNQYNEFPELRKELLGLIKKHSGKICHVGDDTKLREIRDFLKTNLRWPSPNSSQATPKERKLYQDLWHYYNGARGKTVKEKHPRIWNETMKLAKELKEGA